MNRIVSAFTALALIAAPAAAFAQAALPKVPATVKKIDTETGKITLDHGPIPNLDMGAMSMVFKAGGSGGAEDAESWRQGQVHRRPGQWTDHSHLDPES